MLFHSPNTYLILILCHGNTNPLSAWCFPINWHWQLDAVTILHFTWAPPFWKTGAAEEILYSLCSRKQHTAKKHPSPAQFRWNLDIPPSLTLTKSDSNPRNSHSLYFINDKLNCLSPLINWEIMLVSQTLIKESLLPPGSWALAHPQPEPGCNLSLKVPKKNKLASG